MRNASSTHQRNRSKGRNTLLLPTLLLGGALAFLMPEGVTAQPMRWEMPDSVQPLDQVYNVGDDEFIVGLLYNKPTRDPSGTVNILWEFARYMNAADWIWGVGYHRGTSDEDVAHNYKLQLDSLLTLADSAERYLASISPFGEVAGAQLGNNGQMLEVFFFDSVQSPYSVWKFLDVDATKGSLLYNDYYDSLTGQFDWPWKIDGPRERRFTDVQDSGLIAEHLAVAYNTTTDPGWLSHVTNEWEADHFMNLVYSTKGELDRKLSVALKGHLSNSPDDSISPGTTVFRIELYHIVPQGKNYLEYFNDTTDTLITTTAYTERLIDTFSVTKGDLLAGTGDNAAYRDVSFTTDLRYRFGDTLKYGPLAKEFPWKYRDNGSIILDVKVYWTGKEEPSVRSLMLRNPMAQLMYGTSQESQDFRKEVLDSARRVLHGLDSQGEPDLSAPFRKSVMRLDSGHEPFDYGLGAFRALKRYINDSLVYNNGADTVQVGIIMNNPSLQKHMQHIGGMEAVHIEYGYMNFPYDRATGRVEPLMDESVVSLPFYELPAIAEHNGGGGPNFSGPPELKVTADSVELYTETLQRGYYGFYTPTGDKSGHSAKTIQDLGYGARAAATFGRALYGIAGTVARLVIDTTNVTWVTIPPDTTIVGTDTTIVAGYDSLTSTPGVTRYISHQVEASEMRAHANLLLLFGGEGLTYYWLGTLLNAFKGVRVFPAGVNGADTVAWGNDENFSIVGESFTDAIAGNLVDVSDLEVVNGTQWGPVYIPHGVVKDTLLGLWTGWGSRVEEMKSINARVKAVGTEMRKRRLEWRDAYSIHHQAIKPNSSDTSASFPGTRSLPSNEMITKVTARHPITGVVDSAWNTYVELGLFYTTTDTGANPDPMGDRQHAFVLNRRTFERPADIDPLSVRGMAMDALAESRTISLELNLANPDTSEQYNRFLRIREVLPDTASIPLLGPRSGLDTIVTYDANNKSTVELTLGPGRGALLEITYTQPDASIINGRLDRNNQRKMVYEPQAERYYATYYRYDTVEGDYHVYFRRSLPVNETGTILWEPTEHHVSGSLGSGDVATTENFHPSLTCRRISDSLVIASIVWTAHPRTSGFPNKREVLLREVAFHEFYDSTQNQPVISWDWMPTKQSVDHHDGLDPQQWGTPVISSAGFGEYIAWSDSSVGIVARGVLYDEVVASAPNWTPADTVNTIVTQLGYPAGQYPTMPPFTHRGLNDSTAAIAWQQQDDKVYTGIYYGRLSYTPPTAGPAVSILPHPFMAEIFVSPYTGADDIRAFLHPSIDQSQDALTWRRSPSRSTTLRRRLP